MPVGILEIERLDASSRGIPVGKPLRLRRGMLDLALAQPRACVHVRHDDRDVLEPAIVAA